MATAAALLTVAGVECFAKMGGTMFALLASTVAVAKKESQAKRENVERVLMVDPRREQAPANGGLLLFWGAVMTYT